MKQYRPGMKLQLSADFEYLSTRAFDRANHPFWSETDFTSLVYKLKNFTGTTIADSNLAYLFPVSNILIWTARKLIRDQYLYAKQEHSEYSSPTPPPPQKKTKTLLGAGIMCACRAGQNSVINILVVQQQPSINQFLFFGTKFHTNLIKYGTY